MAKRDADFRDQQIKEALGETHPIYRRVEYDFRPSVSINGRCVRKSTCGGWHLRLIKAGAFAGYEVRKRLVRALKVPDFLIALLEDAVAIGGGLLIVSRFDGECRLMPDAERREHLRLGGRIAEWLRSLENELPTVVLQKIGSRV